ncbi:MAG: phosphatase PAP2-related protein [Candidatus Falkowbacteria bacterium]
MKHIFNKHKFYWSQKQFAFSVLLGFFLLTTSLTINYYANLYAIKKAGNSVGDILLNVLPVVNTNIIFFEGAIVFLFLLFVLMVYEPKAIPFVIKSVALFVVIRSFFVVLTHFGPDPTRAPFDDDAFLAIFTSSFDLFFSGHTGLPYLFALIFWQQRNLRWFFLGSSIIAGASVLLAHYHYTIDVASAFFITFGIYHIARKLFKKDYNLFLSDFENKTEAISN